MPPVADIAITMAGKDRADLLRNALESLNQQTLLPKEFILTHCSHDSHAVEAVIKEFQDKTDIPHVHATWVHPHALTRAIARSESVKDSTTKLVVSTETDILFPPDLVERVVGMFGMSPYKKIFGSVGLTKLNQDGSVKFSKPRQKSGAFQSFRREDFDAVGGYNPLLTGWGFEDQDFMNRMVAHGCEQAFCDIFVTHQWHPETRNPKSNRQNKRIAATSVWDGTTWKRTE